MSVDVDINWVVTAFITIVGALVTLYTRAVTAENRILKTELDNMSAQHKVDITRIDESHRDIWEEMRQQRISLNQNREAVIRLNASIERLNDILPRLEQVVMGMGLACSVDPHQGRRKADSGFINDPAGDK
jgi:hypothetical protein